MTVGRGAPRLVALGFLLLLLFVSAFTLAVERGLWPRLPPGALHNSDLVAGLLGGVAIFLLLWRGRERPG